AEAEGSQLLAAANAAAFVFELLEWYQLPPSQAVMPVGPSNPSLPPPCWATLDALRQESRILADRLEAYLRSQEAEPDALVTELISKPPAWLTPDSGNAWATVGHVASGHSEPSVASSAYERVHQSGLPVPSHWLAFAANAALQAHDQARASSLLDEAKRIAPNDVVVQRTSAALDNDLTALREPLPPSAAVAREERLLIETWRGRVLASIDDVAALLLFRELQVQYPERASPRVQQAEILLRRASLNASTDRVADLLSAAELAVSARDMIRQ